MTLTHRKVTDPTGILQQLLKRDGPAQHAVGRAHVSAWSPWKAGAAASTTARGHVQLYNTAISSLLYQFPERNGKNETQSETFVHKHVGIGQAWHVQSQWVLCVPPIQPYLHLTLPGSVNTKRNKSGGFHHKTYANIQYCRVVFIESVTFDPFLS